MQTEPLLNNNNGNMARRSFLRYAGAGVAGVGLLGAASSCHKNHDVVANTATDVGTGDFAALNYLYVLEQIEAAFYKQVIATPYSGITASELSFLTDIRDHEVAHAEYYQAVLGVSALNVTVDLSTINFTTRATVLAAAKSFEDLGVSAYSGVGLNIVLPQYMVLITTIASVEARHAALIDILLGDDFVGSDQVDSNGLNISAVPSALLPTINKYLKTKISATVLS